MGLVSEWKAQLINNYFLINCFIHTPSMVVNPAAFTMFRKTGLPIAYTSPLKLRCLKYSTVAVAGWITCVCTEATNRIRIIEHRLVWKELGQTHDVGCDSGCFEFRQILFIRSHGIIGNVKDSFPDLLKTRYCWANAIQGAFELPHSSYSKRRYKIIGNK